MTGKAALPKLLVVEDDEGLQRQLRWSYDDYEVLIAGDRTAAIDAARQHQPAVVTLDLGLPPDTDGTSEGFATLELLLTMQPDAKVIVATGHGARESALRAIALGAYDYYQKPVDIDELGLIVRRAFHLYDIEAENRRLSQTACGDTLEGLLTGAASMLKTARMAERVADVDVSVMLLGASGTGKEVIARGMHGRSARANQPFVAINCAAIPSNLLEAELFGYEKGAYTGAAKTTEGKIELAEGGTLFLDEVGDIPLPLQVKLLRFLQEKTIERIGGRKLIPVDVRIICATHRDLEAMIAEGSFRDDLYYRLAEIVIRIPPLRERHGDPTMLAHHFLRSYGRSLNRLVTGFAPDALAALNSWHWPGNVRELENRIKRAIIMADGSRITAEDLDLSEGPKEMLNLKSAREAVDRKVISQALARTDGNITGAAKLLGVSRPTFYDLVKQYEISV